MLWSIHLSPLGRLETFFSLLKIEEYGKWAGGDSPAPHFPWTPPPSFIAWQFHVHLWFGYFLGRFFRLTLRISTKILQAIFLSCPPPPCHQIGYRQGGGDITKLEAEFRTSNLPTFSVTYPRKRRCFGEIGFQTSRCPGRTTFFDVLRYPLGPTLRGAIFRRTKRWGGNMTQRGDMTK